MMRIKLAVFHCIRHKGLIPARGLAAGIMMSCCSALLQIPSTLDAQVIAGWTEPEIAAATASTVADYKALHQMPEIGKQEFKTSAMVKDRLIAVGYRTFIPEPTLPTAVIAVLDTGKPGRTVVLRAELDARPQQEEATVDYASKIPGKMHSCGHDAHTAVLLNAASILIRHRAELSGRIVFLFQPAEEIAGGADDIVRDGILQQVKADFVFAQHVAPGLPVGTVQVGSGPFMASSTYFTSTVTGKGGHAASPETSADVIKTAASLVVDLTNFPARHLDVTATPTVITVTSFRSGDAAAANVLPTSAEFGGTLRSFEDIAQTGLKPDGLLTKLNTYLSERVAAEKASVVVKWRNGSPVAINDPRLYQQLTTTLVKVWSGNLILSNERFMASEDFAYYGGVIPSLYFSLGIQGNGRGTEQVHTNTFDVDLDALPVGLRLMLELAQLGTRL